MGGDFVSLCHRLAPFGVFPPLPLIRNYAFQTAIACVQRDATELLRMHRHDGHHKKTPNWSLGSFITQAFSGQLLGDRGKGRGRRHARQ